MTVLLEYYIDRLSILCKLLKWSGILILTAIIHAVEKNAITPFLSNNKTLRYYGTCINLKNDCVIHLKSYSFMQYTVKIVLTFLNINLRDGLARYVRQIVYNCYFVVLLSRYVTLWTQMVTFPYLANKHLDV